MRISELNGGHSVWKCCSLICGLYFSMLPMLLRIWTVFHGWLHQQDIEQSLLIYLYRYVIFSTAVVLNERQYFAISDSDVHDYVVTGTENRDPIKTTERLLDCLAPIILYPQYSDCLLLLFPCNDKVRSSTLNVPSILDQLGELGSGITTPS